MIRRVVKSKDAAVYPTFEPAALSSTSPAGSSGEEGAFQAPGAPDQGPSAADLKAEAEAKVRAAYEEGLRRGEAAGREQFLAKVGEAAEALTTAAHAMQQARAQFLDALEPEVLQLVLAMTERVLRREVRGDRDLIGRTVRAALEELTDHERVTLHLNPEDLEALRAQRVPLLEEFKGVKSLDIVPSTSVEPGGCIAESATMQVDARLHAQLQRLFDAMLE